MYSIKSQGGTEQAYVVELTADLRSDVDSLPTNYQSGSACLVLEDSSVWVLGNDKVWHEL